jgi:hypothetical protein
MFSESQGEPDFTPADRMPIKSINDPVKIVNSNLFLDRDYLIE